jgi:hypothetical protein
MKFPIFNGLISALIFSVSSICAATPFTETALIEPPKGFFVVQAQAAPDATFAALNDGGLEFWLFDARQQTFKPIAKNTVGDANGKTLVLDKKQKQVVQRLKDIRPGTTGVTYISASQQLLLAGREGIYLYQLSQI